jgi:hypothetical protein
LNRPGWISIFALSGFVGHTDWPQILMTSIWVPLVLLFFARVAVRAGAGRHAIEFRYRPASVYRGFGLTLPGFSMVAFFYLRK